MDSARKRSAAVLGPTQASLAQVVDSSIAGVVGAASFARCKTMGVVIPVQVKVHQGVVYIQAFIVDTYVAFSSKASNVWSSAVVHSTRSCETVMVRAAAISQRGRDLANAMRSRTYEAVEATLMKAKDGCLYVQTSVCNAVVRIKVGALIQKGRLAALANGVSTRVCDTVNALTAPTIQRILAVYDEIRSRLTAAWGPYLQKLDGFRSKISTQVDGLVVAMKVRSATARELTMQYPRMFYVKVRGSCVYLYEIVGDKVVGIKIQMNELLAKLNATLVKLNADARVKLDVAKDSLYRKALTVSASVKSAASDKTVQATAAGSFSASAALGAGGAVTGVATGTIVGAAFGVIPAVFTFGLSIPIGAAIGGSAGLVAGSVTGGAVGFVGGGVAGRTAHKHRDQIGDSAAAVANKALNLKAAVNQTSSLCLDQFSEKVSECRTAIVGEIISAAGA